MAAAGSVREALSSASDALSAAGVDGPRYDAELLLAAALGVDRAALTAGPEAEVSASAGRRFGVMVRRRVAREPVAYILGRKGFRRIELEVDCHCLIPRPETELLVELALEVRPQSVADIGTGSGAIALAVADELPAASVIATDTSPDALAIASENADRLGLTARVSFEPGTLPTVRAVDLLLANLPYVRSSEWATLQPEITRFEPRAALVGGEDGLGPIRSLIASVSPPGGEGAIRADAVGLEIGVEQGEPVVALLKAAGFMHTEVRRDLAGLERIVVAR